MGLGLTVPELLVRSVDTQVTEATLEDMLDTILCTRALLHLLRPRLQWHHNIRNIDGKPTGSPKINTRITPYYCVPVKQYMMSL